MSIFYTAFHLISEFATSGVGNLCFTVVGFGLVFWAASRNPTATTFGRDWTSPPTPPLIGVPAPETKSSVHGREIVDVTPGYLMGLFDQHTSIQAQRLVEPYIGKWMMLSGPLADVSASDEFSQLTFDRLALGWPGLVFMYFRQPDRSSRLSVLRRGSTLTVLGQIERVSRVDLHLNNCELI